MSDRDRYVFVYGTLKREKGLNYLLGNSRFVGEASVKGEMWKPVFGGCPYLFEGTENIKGEVWLVPDGAFDMIESVEHGAGYTTNKLQTSLGMVAYAFRMGKWMKDHITRSGGRFIKATEF